MSVDFKSRRVERESLFDKASEVDAERKGLGSYTTKAKQLKKEAAELRETAWASLTEDIIKMAVDTKSPAEIAEITGASDKVVEKHLERLRVLGEKEKLDTSGIFKMKFNPKKRDVKSAKKASDLAVKLTTSDAIKVDSKPIHEKASKRKTLVKKKKLKEKPTITKGRLYVITCISDSGTKYWKIGLTMNDAKSRRDGMATGNPFELEVEWESPEFFGYEDIEDDLHNHFIKQGKHVRGEWFKDVTLSEIKDALSTLLKDWNLWAIDELTHEGSKLDCGGVEIENEVWELYCGKSKFLYFIYKWGFERAWELISSRSYLKISQRALLKSVGQTNFMKLVGAATAKGHRKIWDDGQQQREVEAKEVAQSAIGLAFNIKKDKKRTRVIPRKRTVQM